MNKKTKDIVKALTLEEKAGLCSGQDFWHLKSINRLGLPSIMITDGPHGLRKQVGSADHVGLQNSVPATCFPTASATACSWDLDLMMEMGNAIAKECMQEGVSVILGPGANIKRSPLCGRNFEYISEDPFHTGEVAAALINGIQTMGIGTSLKHYAMNNQETRRMTIDAVVDERTQREIYLAGFEKAVTDSQPWTVMCSYNKVDGTYLSDHRRLLTEILKEEWGHTGLVVTDWGACNDRVEGIKAGLELEMPTSFGINDKKILEAVEKGKLSVELLDRAVERIIEFILKSEMNLKPKYKYSISNHHRLARRIAGESMVLLKNDGVLPLSKSEKIAVIGEFAVKPRYQGAGSSLINPTKLDTLCKILDDQELFYEYSRGYDVKSDIPNQSMIDDAKKLAARADKVLILAGLTENYESEGFDRTHLRMPESHNELIKQVISVNENVTVVLMNGAPVEIPWIDGVKGVLEAYLGGQAGSGAIVDILYGEINPSGKLAETFPVKLEDTPSYRYFPGYTRTVEYREGIYVGYRYYDKFEKDVLFPFGYGLSYTSFSYTDMKVAKTNQYEYDVSLKVSNAGDTAGAEVVQLYVESPETDIYKAKKELKGFKKVYLEPGETKTVAMNLNKRSFAFYNINIPGWHVEKGDYRILVGASSRDIRMNVSIALEASSETEVPDYSKNAPAYYKKSGDIFEISEEQFKVILGRKIPEREFLPEEKFTENSMLGQTSSKWIGRLALKMVNKQVRIMIGESKGEDVESAVRMMESVVREMPLRAIGMMGGDRLPRFFTQGFVEILNGRLLKGATLLLKKK
jgi:beta-glucosidase